MLRRLPLRLTIATAGVISSSVAELKSQHNSTSAPQPVGPVVACTACCGAFRSTRTLFQAPSWESRRSRPWMCINKDCHTVNMSRATDCEACGESKPNLLGWVCMECETRNHRGIKKCKNCAAPASLADGYWACASCNKNNKVDFVDDNSRCGFCGYDMAPMSRSEAEVLAKAQERADMAQMTAEMEQDEMKERQAAGGWGGASADNGWGGAAGGGASNNGFGSAAPASSSPSGKFWESPSPAAASSSTDSGFSSAGGGGGEDADFAGLSIPAAPKAPPAGGRVAEELDMPNYNNMRYEDLEGEDGQSSGAEGTSGGAGGSGSTTLRSNSKAIPKPMLMSQLGGVGAAQTSTLPRRRPRIGSDTPMGPPGFPWMCRECGQHNPGETEGCTRCESLIIPAEWICGTCGGKNHRSRGKCFDCHEKIQPAWTCQACRNETSIYDNHCRTCRAARPEVAQISREEMPMYGIGPKAPKQPAGRPPPPGKQPDWFCTGCRTKNFAFRDRCFGCDLPKPGAAQGGMPTTSDGWGGTAQDPSEQKRAVGDNNWMCRFCRATNFRTRTECWQCKKPATHLGSPGVRQQQQAAAGGAHQQQQDGAMTGPAGFARSASEPSFVKEGFQPGHEDQKAPGTVNIWGKGGPGTGGPIDADWTCTKCFAKNYKNRKECHKCGAMKSSHIMPRVHAKKPVKL